MSGRNPSESHHDRFDKSFVVHMIRDFFLMLLLVGVVEVGIRFFLVWHDFGEDRGPETEQAAEALKDDVRRLMVNSGGPVAARTVYPMLRKNYQERGFFIAINPSEITKTSIEETFDFTPKGIPAEWPKGKNHSFSLPLEADEFCTSCHINANPGDVLGTVTVKSYFATDLQAWWREVKLTGGLGLVKIIFHTIVLFLLLKIRMEPLLKLRAAVSQLAKAGSNLKVRAEVKSHDEFGSLARDLNLFLDRMEHISEDLSAVLDRVKDLNQRLTKTQQLMKHRVKTTEGRLAKVLARANNEAVPGQSFSSEWLVALKTTEMLLKKAKTEKDVKALGPVFADLSEVTRKARRHLEETRANYARFGGGLKKTTREVRGLSNLILEMAVLEEKMKAIAETGKTLVGRLTPEPG